MKPPRLPALLAASALGCAEALELRDVRWSPPDAARDGAASEAGADVAFPPVDPLAPRVAISAPTEGGAVTAERVQVTGTARSMAGVAAVEVRIGPNAPTLAVTRDGFGAWSAEGPAPFGEFTVEAVAVDHTGRRSDAPARVRVTRAGGPADSAPPTVAITSPADNGTALSALVLVRGTARDDRGVTRMELRRNGALLDERPVLTDDLFATWARLVPLEPGALNTVTVTAFDARGGRGEATVRIQSRAEIDRTPPTVAITSPAPATRLAVERLTLSGTASDNSALREVKTRLGAVTTAGAEPAWGEWTPARSPDGFATWSAELPAPVGPIALQARAIDAAGLATTVTVNVTNELARTWSDEVAWPLRLRDGDPVPTVSMVLDRAGVNEVIDATIQRETELLRLNPTALLGAALDAIKTSCGTGWRLDRADPGFDCALTPLGRTYRGADGRWQSSPEFALVRLLTMTPANVDVTGTSIAQLRGIADALGLGGGFSQILADTLRIPRTQEIVSSAAVVTALRQRWLTSHPAIPSDGTLPVTLFDAMNDLAPLAVRFGPSGAHPGLLDPAAPTRSVVFTPGFRMTIVADSNLRWLDGLQLARGKDYMATVVDRRGPTFNDVLEFDFTDPARFDVAGLTPAPTVDMRFLVRENPGFIRACTGEGCQSHAPAAPRPGLVWAAPRWEIEPIVTFAALTEYGALRNALSYLLGAARVRVGQDGQPPGWAVFSTLLSIGSPPPPQYVWELVDEVGQRALHRVVAGGSVTAIPEGQANVAFTLSGIPVGLTAEQIRAAIRPVLQSQASRLSSRLLGDYARNNAALDLFYRRGADNLPYLFFAARGDPRPSPEYRYASPGFFRTASLAPGDRVSATDIPGSGDSAHEKLRVTPGETVVYAQDESGAVYRLRVLAMSGRESEITVALSRRLR